MAQVSLENIYKSFPQRKLRSPASATESNGARPDSVTDVPEEAIQPEGASHGVSVLRRINLTVNDGEFMVLVGPSGCGKSTLLRLIAGLETATAGMIRVGDRPVNHLPPKQRDIAMVFQSYALYPHMTVYENLAFGLRRSQPTLLDGQPKPEWTPRFPLENFLVAATRPLPKGLRYWSKKERQIDHRVHRVAQMLQLDSLLDRLPKQLSGGQKQRVALGRAMARNPQVFLMDEPLSNLDAKLRTETRARIVDLQRNLGTTTIYVTHDQTEAMTMGDRIAVLNGGQIQQIATPLELYKYPANEFVAAFIGSPPMNFLDVQVQAPLLISHPQFRLTLPESWESVLRSHDRGTLRLGIRPEHLTLSAPAPKNLSVRIERVEALGSETYISAHFQEDREAPSLQVRIDSDHRVVVGDELWLAIAPDKIHLFDPATGLAIAPQ
ncbi:MAG: ABC transporter ATP-binding protein [Cyanobacteria bacterium J06638_22]